MNVRCFQWAATLYPIRGVREKGTAGAFVSAFRNVRGIRCGNVSDVWHALIETVDGTGLLALGASQKKKRSLVHNPSLQIRFEGNSL